MSNKAPENRLTAPVAEMPGIHIKTFGCQMNEYDSQKMYSMFSATHQLVDSANDAEIVIVNTCSIREKAEKKLYDTLGRLREIKKVRPELIVGVGGCVAQQDGKDIIKECKSVDFVVGTHNLSLIPALVESVKNGRGPQVAVDYREEWEELPEEFDFLPPALSPQEENGYSKLTGTPAVRALVAIQRGCSKNCAFCVVPNTRGKEVSRNPQEILREIQAKVRQGAKEVLLLGQTVNSYGRDLTPRHSFEQLIRDIAKIEGLLRIRFISPHPQEVRAGFIELYGEVPQLCPQIHLPLQSGSDRILKLMNRNYRRARYLDIVQKLRDRLPQISISSDFIVGFPTETEEDFQQTLEMMETVRYGASFSFIYSPRPNTVAGDLYSSEQLIPADIAKERLQRLMEAQDRIAIEINSAKLGAVVEVLVERSAKGISSAVKGRIGENTQVEVHGEVNGSTPKIGELVKARVIHAGSWGLRAELES